jgi:hypothetical protein
MSQDLVGEVKKKVESMLYQACGSNPVHYASLISSLLQDALVDISKDYSGFMKLLDIFYEETKRQALILSDKKENADFNRVNRRKRRKVSSCRKS